MQNCRAIASGPVSQVDHFSLTCLASPISAIAQWTPTQCPKVHRYHVETCEMAVNSATQLFHKSSFQQLSVLACKRMISLASLTCEGCSFRLISWSESWYITSGVRRNGRIFIHVKLCHLASEKHHNGSKFFWVSMPQTLLAYSVLVHVLWTKSDGYGPGAVHMVMWPRPHPSSHKEDQARAVITVVTHGTNLLGM